MGNLSPQTLYLAGAAVVLILWYKGYLDGLISQLGFSGPARGTDDGLYAAVAKSLDDAERAAKRELADRLREQIQAGVKANFGAAGQNTQAQSPPANPAPSI